MSVLSAQSIRRLSMADPPLVSPFSEREVVRGKSFGLSSCTYDCRIAEDLVLEPMPFEMIAEFMRENRAENWANTMRRSAGLQQAIGKWRALASTIERICLPDNVCASVLDKSSYARVFVSAFNTHFDPGFHGWATIELTNLGTETVRYQRGDPVCQFKFEWLDEPTELPYRGKYQNQETGPQPARFESVK